MTVNTSATVTANIEPEPEAETPEATAKAKLTESQVGMSHVIATPPEGDTCEWHCDDGCPFIVRDFRRRSLRNCKACTPNNAIDGDAVYFTPTGKCIHKQECQYLLNSIRISAIKCEHCFQEASHA